MPNYLRNSDDGVSDPDIIAARYRLQRSAFLEAQLVETELESNASNNSSGGSASNAILGVAAAGGYTPARPDPEDPE